MNDMANGTLGSQKTETYDDTIVRYFLFATTGWGIVAFTLGIWVALQMAYWKFNFNNFFCCFGKYCLTI